MAGAAPAGGAPTAHAGVAPTYPCRRGTHCRVLARPPPLGAVVAFGGRWGCHNDHAPCGPPRSAGAALAAATADAVALWASASPPRHSHAPLVVRGTPLPPPRLSLLPKPGGSWRPRAAPPITFTGTRLIGGVGFL